jgi:hypothetical protein
MLDLAIRLMNNQIFIASIFSHDNIFNKRINQSINVQSVPSQQLRHL